MLCINILIFSGILFCLSISFYLWKQRKTLFADPPIFKEGNWNLPVYIDEHSLGKVEGCNPLLKEVLVVAHQIEEPKNGLLRAVRKNFKKKVKYRFLISKSKYETEKDRYLRVFEGYANVDSPENFTHKDLVFIQKIKQEWDDVPYLFYRCTQPTNPNKEFIFGYRGTQMFEGIADSYLLLEPAQARTFFRFLELISDDKIPNLSDIALIPEGKKVIDATELFNKKSNII